MWISYAQFELSVGTNEGAETEEGASSQRPPSNISKARAVYADANKRLKDCQDKEERLMLLESWKEFEVSQCLIFLLVIASYWRYMISTGQWVQVMEAVINQ